MYTVRKSAKARKISTDVGIEAMPPGMKDGDKFTVGGVKVLANGKTIYNCKPGEETVFTAKRIITGDIKTCTSSQSGC